MATENFYSLAIEQDNEKLSFEDGVYDITIKEGSEYNATFNVVCDGEKDRLSFMMEVFGEGITVIQNRCDINVHIDKNLTQEEKEFSIFFTHSNDMYEMLQLNFIQKPETFEITTDIDNIEFLSYLEEEDKKNDVKRLNNSDVFYQDKVVKVTASGGSKKWRILSVRRKITSTYNYYEYELDEDGNIKIDKNGKIQKTGPYTEKYEYYSSFDNEFVCIKKDNELIVRSYGKAFMDKTKYFDDEENGEEDKVEEVDEPEVKENEEENKVKELDEVSHFEITVCHRDNKHITKVITVNYDETNYEYEEEEIETPDNSIKHKELYEDLVKSKSDEEEDDENDDEKQEETTYTLTIENKNITITEPKREDNTNSYSIKPSANYRCTTYTSAKWCSVELIGSQINIKITDKPLLQRKCLVRISIAAMPEVCADFIVINEPEVETTEMEEETTS